MMCDFKGGELTTINVSGAEGFGSRQRQEGDPATVDGWECRRAKCVRRVGGRRSIFYVIEYQLHDIDDKYNTYGYGLHHQRTIM